MITDYSEKEDKENIRVKNRFYGIRNDQITRQCVYGTSKVSRPPESSYPPLWRKKHKEWEGGKVHRQSIQQSNEILGVTPIGLRINKHTENSETVEHFPNLWIGLFYCGSCNVR